EPPFALLEQALDESIGACHFFADDGLPQRSGVGVARRRDAVVADAYAGRERREDRRRPLVHPPQQSLVASEKCQRLVVQPGETVADERRLTVGDDRADEFVLADPLVEDRVSPDVRAQRDGNDVRRTRRTEPRRAPALRLTHGLEKRRGRRRTDFRRVVDEARDLGHVAAAIRYGIDRERVREARGAAGNRRVFVQIARRVGRDLKCRYNQNAHAGRQAFPADHKAHIIDMASGNYTAKDITVLEGLEPVRKRPGMYIGGVGSTGLHQLFLGGVDNSPHETINGAASKIWGELLAPGTPMPIEEQT